jgi:hypothetical protein
MGYMDVRIKISSRSSQLNPTTFQCWKCFCFRQNYFWKVSTNQITHGAQPFSKSRQLQATKELTSILRNPQVHYDFHKSPPLVPILSHIKPNHTVSSYLSKILLSTHLHFGLPSGLVPSDFLTNILYAFLFCPHPCYILCPFHPP